MQYICVYIYITVCRYIRIVCIEAIFIFHVHYVTIANPSLLCHIITKSTLI